MIKVRESEMMDRMRKQIEECDAEDLAVLAEHMFGGKFFVLDEESLDEWMFELEPDENYMGAFGEDDDK